MIGPAGTFAAPDLRETDGECFTPEQANQHAIAWCAKRPAWVRICEVGETDQYYVQWNDLKASERDCWGSEYSYNEFAQKRQKIAMGFISGKGEFYDDIMKVPLFHNFMMVLRVGAKQARASRKQHSATAQGAGDQ